MRLAGVAVFVLGMLWRVKGLEERSSRISYAFMYMLSMFSYASGSNGLSECLAIDSSSKTEPLNNSTSLPTVMFVKQIDDYVSNLCTAVPMLVISISSLDGGRNISLASKRPLCDREKL